MSLNKDVALKTIHYNTNKKTHNEIKTDKTGLIYKMPEEKRTALDTFLRGRI